MYHVGETVTSPTDREWPRAPQRSHARALQKIALRAITEILRIVPENPEPIWQGE
jgi:hypothetical protein